MAASHSSPSLRKQLFRWVVWPVGLTLLGSTLLLYQLTLYLGLHVMQRYLFQMLPVLCAFGASLVAARESAVVVVTPLRLAAGTLIATLLLALAFLGPWLDGSCG